MCERALLLKQPLIQFLNLELELANNFLSPKDQGYLKNLTKFLEPFRDVTKANEGVKHLINQILPGMKFLIKYLKEALTDYANNPFMAD